MAGLTDMKLGAIPAMCRTRTKRAAECFKGGRRDEGERGEGGGGREREEV